MDTCTNYVLFLSSLLNKRGFFFRRRKRNGKGSKKRGSFASTKINVSDDVNEQKMGKQKKSVTFDDREDNNEMKDTPEDRVRTAHVNALGLILDCLF